MLDVVPIMRSVPPPVLVSPAAPESVPPSSSVAPVAMTFTIRSGAEAIATGMPSVTVGDAADVTASVPVIVSALPPTV